MAASAGALFVVWGLYIGARPFDDNSFLTHLATGRLILADGVPRADPYSFTAAGESWSVQSWLVSVAFAAAERVAGGVGVHLVVMAATAAIAGLVWTLTRPAEGLLARMLLAFMATGVGAVTWSERPLLVGLLGLCLVLLAAEDRLDPRWLVPVFWVWVNSHGSFPLGLVALGALWAGARLDGRDGDVERRALLWSVVGVLVGVVGPLGSRILLFPVELLSQNEALAGVVEWSSPTFDETWTRLFLVQVAVAVLLLVRRPSYRAAIPLVVFVAAALLAARNVSAASIVLLPGMAVGFAGIGRLKGDERSLVLVGGVGAVALLGLLLAAGTLAEERYDLDPYPVEAVAWMEANGFGAGERRVAHQDVVGNYLEAVKGADADVFFDDRYDMYPLELVEDYEVLLAGGHGWAEVLDRHDVDTVLWERNQPLASVLEASPGWRAVYVDDGWVVACRRGTC